MKKIAWVIVITLVLIAVQLPVRAGAIAEGCAGLKLTEILANVDEVDRFIEIFNSTAAPMDLTGCQIITLNEGGNPPSGSKTWAFGAEILDAGQYRAVKITDTTLKLNKTTGGTIRILSADGVVDEVIYNKQSANKSWALIGGIWQNANSTPGAANEQVVKPPVDPDPDPEPGDGGDTDPEPPTEPIEPTGNACAELKITEIVANVDENDKFIEIFNPTAVPLNLAGCLIITYNESGNPPSGSKMWNFGAEFLDAAAFRVVKIIDTTLKLNKTTGGTVCILSIYGLVEEDCVSYSKLKSGSAWALIGEEWQEIFTPTPGA
ncbi:lamin tail domain-containing protein, partial [Candidatus Saccharibacteria bacterium]|nr:lamin tail domain-containing protein [Candidatus Saccharibacteria bacterium]